MPPGELTLTLPLTPTLTLTLALTLALALVPTLTFTLSREAHSSALPDDGGIRGETPTPTPRGETYILVPMLHYPHGFDVYVSDGEVLTTYYLLLATYYLLLTAY